MSKTTELPVALWRANLALQSRIAGLLQESSREWLGLGTQAAGESAAEWRADVEALARGGDWHALAALPIESFWRQAEQRMADGHALVQASVNAQQAFAKGLVEALQAWRRDTAEAIGDTGGLSGADAIDRLAAVWEPLVAALAPEPGKGSRKRGG